MSYLFFNIHYWKLFAFRNSNCDFGTFSDLTVNCNCAVVILNSVFYNWKTKSSSAWGFWMTFIYSVKTFKNMILFFRSNADSVVFYFDNRVAFCFRDRNVNFSAVFIIFNCIVAKVKYNFINNAAGAKAPSKDKKPLSLPLFALVL